MDLKKTGNFLKELRKENNMTAGAAVLLVAFIIMRTLGLLDTTSSYKNLADFNKGNENK